MNTTPTEIRSEPCVRNRLHLAPQPPASEARSYLRRLRAAEMAAWERSGGDYLLPNCAKRIECVLTVG